MAASAAVHGIASHDEYIIHKNSLYVLTGFDQKPIHFIMIFNKETH